MAPLPSDDVSSTHGLKSTKIALGSLCDGESARKSPGDQSRQKNGTPLGE
jgi:hypothetical protein